MCALLVGFALGEELGDGGYRGVRGGMDGHLAREDFAIGESFAVVGGRVFLVLVDGVAGEVEDGEEDFATRVGEVLRSRRVRRWRPESFGRPGPRRPQCRRPA